VNFAAPVSLDEWLAGHPGLLQQPREERLPRLEGLAGQVMERIAARHARHRRPAGLRDLLEDDAPVLPRAEWEARVERALARLRAAGAHVVGGDRSAAEVLDRGS
jgi:hypothetical protein